MPRKTPIFVVGRHRSGTTWLANELCKLEAIAGVQHEAHYGIKESTFFSHVHGRYGPIEDEDNYRDLVDEFAASDYYRITGLGRAFLESLTPSSYEGFFRTVMEAHAEREGAEFWLEKTPAHTFHVEDILRYYPEAHVVGIRRALDEVTASSLAQNHTPDEILGWNPAKLASKGLRIGLSWSLYDRVLERAADRYDRMRLVEFDDFRRDTQGTIDDLLEFVGCKSTERGPEPDYRPNSSFEDRSGRQALLDHWVCKAAKAGGALGRIAPLGLLERTRRLRKGAPGKRPLNDHFRTGALEGSVRGAP